LRIAHWQAFSPICPRCLRESGTQQPLRLLTDHDPGADTLRWGFAVCPHTACQQRYPIIDGVPVLVPDLPEYLQGWGGQILLRDDLDPDVAALVADALPAGDGFQLMRQYLSTYAWDGYSEFDPDLAPARRCGESSAVASVEAALAGLAPAELSAADLLDLGCGAGRSTFELARRSEGLVLGIERNFAFARLAQRILLDGTVCYPLRRTGVVYEERRYPVGFADAERVDFWVCDAAALPFPGGRIHGLVGFNLLDSVASPVELLAAIERVLITGGFAALTSPFEWREDVTPRQAWLGGHSSHAAPGGDPVEVLRRLLATETYGLQRLRIEHERDGLRWCTRIDDRAVTEYTTYLARLRKD
jgi:SAM-dependent methyltransferase/uncharacterized protein YbaR (Trm112 family)